MSDVTYYYELEKILNESICLNDNPSIDTLLEMLSLQLDMTDYGPISLLENTNILNSFNEYIPLIESVNELASAQKDFKELKKDVNNDNIFKKCLKSLKGALNWWYKVEPDKKFKTLHVILKILVYVLIFIGKIPDKVFHIGKASVSTKYTVLLQLISMGVSQIETFILGLSSKAEYEINKNDLDKNISEFDAEIDKINDQLSKNNDPEIEKKLIETKSKLSDALAKLIRIKDKNNKDR